MILPTIVLLQANLIGVCNMDVKYTSMREVYLDIETELCQGHTCEAVAAKLKVPVHWVYTVHNDIFLNSWDKEPHYCR